MSGTRLAADVSPAATTLIDNSTQSSGSTRLKPVAQLQLHVPNQRNQPPNHDTAPSQLATLRPRLYSKKRRRPELFESAHCRELMPASAMSLAIGSILESAMRPSASRKSTNVSDSNLE